MSPTSYRHYSLIWGLPAFQVGGGIPMWKQPTDLKTGSFYPQNMCSFSELWDFLCWQMWFCKTLWKMNPTYLRLQITFLASSLLYWIMQNFWAHRKGVRGGVSWVVRCHDKWRGFILFSVLICNSILSFLSRIRAVMREPMAARNTPWQHAGF